MSLAFPRDREGGVQKYGGGGCQGPPPTENAAGNLKPRVGPAGPGGDSTGLTLAQESKGQELSAFQAERGNLRTTRA